MPYLLNLFYVSALLLMTPWLMYRYAFHGKYRKSVSVRLLGRVPIRSGQQPCAWFEAASLGEVKLIEPVIRRFQREHPDWRCVMSASTTSGYHLATRLYPGMLVFPLPVDFTWAIRTALRRIRPDLIVLTDLEVWPNLVTGAKQHGVKLAILNGRVTDRNYRDYSAASWFVSPALSQIDLIAAQNAEYARRFVKLGANSRRISIIGSLKFDSVETDRRNPTTCRLTRLAQIKDEDVVFMAGNTFPGEEAVALEAFSQLRHEFPRLRLVIAPRNANRFAEVGRLLDRSGIPWYRCSMLKHVDTSVSFPILMLDELGELSAWWGTSHIAFVGGSLFRHGGKNMMEAAAYGTAVAFGPNTQDFRGIADSMIAHKAATVVCDTKDLIDFIRLCLVAPDRAARLGQCAQQMIVARGGAAAVAVDLLSELVSRQKYASGAAADGPSWDRGMFPDRSMNRRMVRVMR